MDQPRDHRVDVFCHFLPKRYEAARWQRASRSGFAEHVLHGQTAVAGTGHSAAHQELVDLDARFRLIEEFENYRQVLTIAGPPIEVVAPDDSDTVAKIANDELAELVEKYPLHFAGAVATLPMDRPDDAALELDRAIRDLKLIGVQLYSNVRGKALDLPEFRPLFQMMSEFDLPILLHPARSKQHPDYLTEASSQCLIWQVFGWPYESSAAMARIVFSGILAAYPNLKIIVHHTGAMIPYFAGRIEAMYTLFQPLVQKERGTKLQRPAIEYFRRFYADTSTFTAASIECACDFFGPDHVLLGTDAPFDAEGGRFSIRECIRAVENSSLDAAEKRKIFYENFEALFRRTERRCG